MPPEKDEFDSVLEDAVRTEDDLETGLDLGDDEPDDESERRPEPESDDDSEPAIERARAAEAAVSQAADVARQWDEHHKQVDAEFKAAQEKYKEIRKKAMAGDASDDDEIAAQDAVFEARLKLDKARDGLSKASDYYQKVASAPKLAPAQQAWLDANPKYTTDPRFQKQAQQVMRELAESGMDVTHQNFYRKVDEKLRAPTRMGKDSRRTPGAPAVRTEKKSDDTGRMSESEAKFVSKLGYDPRDKRVAEQWQRSKANTRRVAQKRGFL
ncbi:MAG: hypothetical protein WAU86_07315 [Oricola sp.]